MNNKNNQIQNKWLLEELRDWCPNSATIVVDNYNYARFVKKAVESALAQTCRAQVIVIDDGSTDGSREIISSFGDRIEAVFKTNGGQASAFNAGFARANGDIIIFLDSDDMLEPDAVATLLDLWRPGAMMAHYPMTMIDQDDRPIGFIPNPPDALADGDVRAELLATGLFACTVTTGNAFSRAALERIMPMPESDFIYAADGYLVRAAAFLGPVQHVEKWLARYRAHGKNDSDPWNTPGGYAAGFRKKIKYKQNEIETTKKLAAMCQLPVVARLGENDPDYLGFRLFSLILDPANHPVRKDRRPTLLMRYIVSRLASPWPLPRRIMAVILAALATFSTHDAATLAIRMMHDSSVRPAWFRNAAEWLRRKRTKSLPASQSEIMSQKPGS